MNLAKIELIIIILITIYFLNEISLLNKKINFYIQSALDLDRENKLLKEEKSAMKKFLALDKSNDW
jgi:hypothetical protein